MTHVLIENFSQWFKLIVMKILLAILLSVPSVWAARPDNAFSFKENTCVCRNSQPVSRGDCTNVCRGKNTKGADVLFADFSVSSVLANSSLKHVKNWCYKYLIGDSAFPKCALEARDSQGNKTLLTNFNFPKNNSISVDVSSLADDESYWFRLVETTSKAGSIPQEIFLFDPVGYPLKTTQFSQFSCYPKTSKDQRVNFYFGPYAPTALRGDEKVVCHDVVKYGEKDSELFPRLDLTTPVAALWNQQNYLFYDNNGDGVLDVNELVIKKITEAGGETSSKVRLFGLLSAPGTKDNNIEAGNSSYDRLGVLMSYWVESVNFNSFCPDEKDYATGKPEFKAMQEILGKGTEGIYVADRSENEMKSYLLIRESDVRSVWFYMNNGTPAKPSEDQIQFQTIYFYYPINRAAPYVKAPHQKLYRVRSVSELGSNLTTLQAFLPTTGEMISYPAHDRKIGCVPKL